MEERRKEEKASWISPNTGTEKSEGLLRESRTHGRRLIYQTRVGGGLLF